MVQYDFPRPIVTVDVVLFTVSDVVVGRGKGANTEKRVHVALAPRRSDPLSGALALPGTYVHPEDDYDLEASAVRVLRGKCGLAFGRAASRRGEEAYVEQLRTYSGRDRDPRGWSTTTAFYALVPRRVLEAGLPDIQIVPADGLKGLPFDHDLIVADGLERIRGKATYSTLPAKLLPKTFTFSDLEQTYEAVLGRKVHTASFRRKISELVVEIRGADTPWLVDTGEVRRNSGGRPGALYAKAVDHLVTFPQRF